MSVFENFPYTNFHDLNLDWVLNKLKSFEERLNKIETNGPTGGTPGGTPGGDTGGTSPDIAALAAKIDAKQDKLTFDSTPTENSNNPVTSGGVYTATDGNRMKVHTKTYAGGVDDNGDDTGYTLTNNSYVQITTDSVIAILRPHTIPIETITSISITIKIDGGLIAQGLHVGVYNFRNTISNPKSHYFASCYHDSTNSILNFDILLSDEGMSIRLIAPSSFGSDTLHIERIIVELAYQDNIIAG